MCIKLIVCEVPGCSNSFVRPLFWCGKRVCRDCWEELIVVDEVRR